MTEQGEMVSSLKRVDLDIRRKLLTQRVVRHKYRLPKAAEDAPSLEAFKARLEGPWAA